MNGNLTEITGFSLSRPKFNTRVVHGGFVVDKVALQQDFSASFYSTNVPLMLFVVKNKNLFTLNSENHTKSTRQFNDFYQPITNFTVYQRGAHYKGIRIFNNFPPYIKDIYIYIQ